jgi:hypothetical protein
MSQLEQAQQLLDTTANNWANTTSEAQLLQGTITPVYAASYTPTLQYAFTTIVMGILTGAQTIGAPIGARVGMRLTFNFRQDATGGRVVTWNAIFKKGADAAGTANQSGTTSFVFNGTNWVQDGGVLTYL